jgi:hypothetical protein
MAIGARLIEWDVAEVLGYDYTYQYIPPDQINSNVDKLFALKVRSCSGYFNNNIYIVRPSNINLKQIPLVGEFVLIYKTFNEQSTSTTWREAWYYVTSVDIQSSINENMLPGLSDGLTQEEIDQIQPGKTFQRKSIAPLQPYEGDFIMEGRFGNSIRFSSTIPTNAPEGYYWTSPSWTSGKTNSDGDPIIILANGHIPKTKKEFVVEDVDLDASSIYLTSTQKIPLLLSSELKPEYASFQGSQLIGSGDRIILRAKTNSVIIDSMESIILNTPGDVLIGSDSADEPLPHGNVLIEIIMELISAIGAGATSPGGPCVTNGSAQLQNALTKLQTLNSSKYKIKKT